MNNHEKLDWLLKYLAEHNVEEAGAVSEDPTLIPVQQKEILLDQLVTDGYASKVRTPVGHPAYNVYENLYQVTLKGLLFREKSSYIKEVAKKKREKAWTILKIIAAVLNALAIIWLGYKTMEITREGNEDKAANGKLRSQIDSLNKIIVGLMGRGKDTVVVTRYETRIKYRTRIKNNGQSFLNKYDPLGIIILKNRDSINYKLNDSTQSGILYHN